MRAAPWCRSLLGTIVVLALVLCGSLLDVSSAGAITPINPACPSANSYTSLSCTFTTVGQATYTVPSGVTAVTVTAVGAPGGGSPYGTGTDGANATATVPVTGGSTLYAEVGGAGATFSTAQGSPQTLGGANGGGNAFSAGAGGGESDVRTCSTGSCSLSSNDTRLVVAGGGGGHGGGGSCSTAGGAGGKSGTGAGNGGSGGACPNIPGYAATGVGGNGGFGGGAGAGGNGANWYPAYDNPGGPGGLGKGGVAAPVPNSDSPAYYDSTGGGGGAGYYGGGGGGDSQNGGPNSGGGGGGAGSSYWKPTATNTSLSTDTTGTPEVVITAVETAPSITSASSTTFPVGQSGSFTVNTTGYPSPALSENGALPSGVTFVDNGDGTATLAGTPASATEGTYPFTITASNGTAPDASQSFTLQIGQPPAITSASSTSFTAGQYGSFTVHTSADPTASLSDGGATLPGGVTFVDDGDGTATIAGTPDANVGGPYTFTITASNGLSPSTSQGFTLNVDLPPNISSGSSTSFTVGHQGGFSVYSSGYPKASLSDGGATLPSGVTFADNGDGSATLYGTPASGTAGTYTFTITASNGTSPNATQSFTLTVNQEPAITSDSSATFTADQYGGFVVGTTGYPHPSLSESGSLPFGVTFVDNGYGSAVLSGTPDFGTGGIYTFTITASNGVWPDALQSFTLTVNQAPLIEGYDSTSFTTGQPGSFTVRTIGYPNPTLSDGGATLPSGVTFVDNGDGTATLSGTPDSGTAGSYPFTITASNGISPDDTQSFTLTVDQAPAITSASSVSFTPGQNGSFTVNTTGSPTPSLSDGGATLPNGVTFTDNGDGTATISGTPGSATAGSYPFTITASNGTSPDATQSFTLTVPGPSDGSLPQISGTTQVGQQLKTTNGSWSSPSGSLSYSYRWQRCDSSGADCQPINPTQTQSQFYRLTKADLGHQISVAVTATDANQDAATAFATPVGTITAPPAPSVTSMPQISGTTEVGQELKTTHGTWSSLDTPLSYSYKWQRCDSSGDNCQEITPAQTRYYYYLTNADIGHQITVAVTATDAGNQATTQPATPVGTVATPASPTNNTLPQISGTTKVGQLLRTTSGSWSSQDGRLSYSYQWQRCDSTGDNCQEITPAQTRAEYTLTGADLGHQITVAVTATDTNSDATTKSATPVGTITLPPAPSNTILPQISGNTQVGQQLKSTTGTWSSQDGPLIYSYQWQRCDSAGANCQEITPAQTHSYYYLTNADIDHQITVAVTATDKSNQTTTQPATPVGAITSAPTPY